MDPLTILYCWQTLLLAGVSSASTELVKRLIDVLLAMPLLSPAASNKAVRELGLELRKNNYLLQRVVMPTVPLVFASLFALVLPSPEALTDYAVAQALPPWRVYAMLLGWGLLCGQFADYVFSKIKAALDARSASV